MGKNIRLFIFAYLNFIVNHKLDFKCRFFFLFYSVIFYHTTYYNERYKVLWFMFTTIIIQIIEFSSTSTAVSSTFPYNSINMGILYEHYREFLS